MKLTTSFVIVTLVVACCQANPDLKTGFEILQQCYKASSLSDDLISKSKESITKYVRNMKPGDGSEAHKKLEQEIKDQFIAAGVESELDTVSDCMKSNMPPS